jgi:protein-tyrosine kinase
MNAPPKMNDGFRNRTIGAILVEEGRLRPEDADRIVKLQGKKGLTFGEAAKRLRMLSDDDIQYALAQQFDHPYLMPGRSRLSKELIAAFTPVIPAVENLRAVRNQLMLRWFGVNPANRAIAIVSTDSGDGRSWVAANLAVVFSQIGERTLLIDSDLRHPRQHRLFGIDNKIGLTTLLAARSAEGAIQGIPELPNLSVLPAGTAAPNPQELITRSTFGRFLDDVKSRFDIIIFDTPSASNCADAQMLAVRAGAALVIAYDRRSRIAQLARLADDMRQGGVQIVGSLIRAG